MIRHLFLLLLSWSLFHGSSIAVAQQLEGECWRKTTKYCHDEYIQVGCETNGGCSGISIPHPNGIPGDTTSFWFCGDLHPDAPYQGYYLNNIACTEANPAKPGQAGNVASGHEEVEVFCGAVHNCGCNQQTHQFVIGPRASDDLRRVDHRFQVWSSEICVATGVEPPPGPPGL